jgi:UDP-N-acetylmuramoyl-tripeptide--D-alanyl-D-alanine ligase
MPISLTLDELLKVVDGVSNVSDGVSQLGKDGARQPSICFSGLEFDSRLVRENGLFVALKGDKAHGHDFLDQAFKQSAALALVEDPGLLKNSVHKDKLVLVPDSLKALAKLATDWRERLSTKILAITGSVGKTTVKELSGSVLGQHSKGYYAKKSFNNHIGVPYSLCQISLDDKWAVLELGMNHAGELTALSQIVKPEIAMITAIAPAHFGFFNSIEAIAEAKWEITTGIKQGGTLLLNGDDRVLMRILEKKRTQLSARSISVKTVAANTDADLSLVGSRLRGVEGSDYTFSYAKADSKGATKVNLARTQFTIRSKLLGQHTQGNIALALLAAKEISPDLDLQLASKGLEEFNPPSMRLNLFKLADGRALIDDSYNANPGSVLAALTLLGEFKGRGLRVGVVLGDMLELGEHSKRYHLEMGAKATQIGSSFVIAVGNDAKYYLEGAKGQIELGKQDQVTQHNSMQSESISCELIHAETPELAAKTAINQKFDLLLVKGSRGLALDRCVELIKQHVPV